MQRSRLGVMASAIHSQCYDASLSHENQLVLKNGGNVAYLLRLVDPIVSGALYTDVYYPWWHVLGHCPTLSYVIATSLGVSMCLPSFERHRPTIWGHVCLHYHSLYLLSYVIPQVEIKANDAYGLKAPLYVLEAHNVMPLGHWCRPKSGARPTNLSWVWSHCVVASMLLPWHTLVRYYPLIRSFGSYGSVF